MSFVYTKAKAFRDILFGVRVDRGATSLPQSTTGALFNVKGGRVAITQIVGEVTTVLGDTATNAKLVSTPTVGTATDLCAVLAVASKEAGTLLGITGLNSDAMIGLNAGSLPGQVRPVVVAVGAIGLNTSANNTGAIKWTVFYVPVDDGAFIEAV